MSSEAIEELKEKVTVGLDTGGQAVNVGIDADKDGQEDVEVSIKITDKRLWAIVVTAFALGTLAMKFMGWI